MKAEEHREKRAELYKDFKRDCPQTIGETDAHFDCDNFADYLVDRYIELSEQKKLTSPKEPSKSAEEILNPIMDEVDAGIISPKDLEIKLWKAMEEYRNQSHLQAKPVVSDEEIERMADEKYPIRVDHRGDLPLLHEAVNSIKNQAYKEGIKLGLSLTSEGKESEWIELLKWVKKETTLNNDKWCWKSYPNPSDELMEENIIFGFKQSKNQ